MVKRAIIAGRALDRRRHRRPARASVGGEPPPAEGGELRRRRARRRQRRPTPRSSAIQFYERPGIQLTAALQKEIEKNFTRHEVRRVGAADVGTISYPARAAESYAADLLSGLDIEAIRERGFRIVVDYGYSAASLVLPLVLGPLGVEVVAAHAFTTGRLTPDVPPLHESIGQTKNLVRAVGAELGVVFDRAASASTSSTSRRRTCRSTRRSCSTCA